MHQQRRRGGTDRHAAASPVTSSAATPSTPSAARHRPARRVQRRRSRLTGRCTTASLDRRGVSTTMPAVSRPAAGRRRSSALDGNVYASPVVVGGITVVATEHDSVYALRQPRSTSCGNATWALRRRRVSGRAATSTRSASPGRRSSRTARSTSRPSSAARRGTNSSRSTCTAARSNGSAASTCPAWRPPRCRSAARSPSPADGCGCPSAGWPATAAATRAGSSACRWTAPARPSPTPCRPRARPGSGRRPDRRSTRSGDLLRRRRQRRVGHRRPLRHQRLGAADRH